MKNSNSRARIEAKIERWEEERELKLVPLVDLQFCCPGRCIDHIPK